MSELFPNMPAPTKLKPCPFCGSTDIDPEGWCSTDSRGPACMECSGSAQTIELWNSRPIEDALNLNLPPNG